MALLRIGSGSASGSNMESHAEPVVPKRRERKVPYMNIELDMEGSIVTAVIELAGSRAGEILFFDETMNEIDASSKDVKSRYLKLLVQQYMELATNMLPLLSYDDRNELAEATKDVYMEKRESPFDVYEEKRESPFDGVMSGITEIKF